MKEIIRQKLEKETQPPMRKLVLAECLQHLLLQSLYRQGVFEHLVFTGGTALRIIYQTNRYSEDLDFSLEKSKGFRLDYVLQKAAKDLSAQQLPFEFYLKNDKTVATADLRFQGLLKEFNLSALKDQKLTIKFEVDKRPPKGGTKEIMLVTTPVSYTVVVYDLPSLFATKLHAIFFRGYVKGRDYYDLVWYLGQRVKPNFTLLNNAIRQTEGKTDGIRENNFKETLVKHLEGVDFKKVRSEAERFVIDYSELKFLDLDPIRSLLRAL